MVLLAALPATAHAHAFPGAGDFYGGMLHMLSALETLTPTIALGMLAAQQGRDAAVRVLGIAPLALLAGAAIGAALGRVPDLGVLELGAMLVLGVLVAGAWPLPRAALLALAAIVGLTLGFANGGEIGAGASIWRFAPGVAIGGLLVLAYTISAVRWLTAGWTRIAVRVAGSWIAAVGLMVLALRI